MFKKLSVSILLVSIFVLSACGSPQPPAPTAIPTPQLPGLPTVVPPTQALVLPTAANPTATVAPTATQMALSTGLPEMSAAVYLDDRSTPAALMLSYFNAINRQEYLRAYSYYTNYTDLGTLDSFSKGYSDTQSVRVVIGDIFSEGAAGSVYSTVPMLLNVTTTAGVQQKFAACYVLRFPQPANYGAPPITPMHLDRGTAHGVALTVQDADALASACPSADYPTGPGSKPASVELLSDLSTANYIDNRSDPVTVLSSYLNAINRKEYVRAYSYWQSSPTNYAAFAAGYAHTASVTAQFGTATPDAGAGQIYYSLPVGMKSTLDDGTTQTFVACYSLHLSQPGIQGTLPFEPLGIKSATVKQVDNGADIPSMLATACQ